MIVDNNKCLICGSKNVNQYDAKFAEFIVARVFDGKNKDFNLVQCKDCGFSFFTYRFEDKEVQKLYTNYRDDEYQKQRQFYDSWYTKSINDLIGKNKKEIKSRNANLTKILKTYADISKIKKVLDFGGDEGQFIPNILNNSQKYVYDISGVKTLDGIISLKTLDDCKKITPDFVMCNHVLEHVVNPLAVVEDIKSILKSGAYLYVELPFDSPFYKNSFSNLQYLFNPYFSLKNIWKQYIKMKQSNAYLMNEHINYYTPASIELLLKNSGFKILYNDVIDIKSEIGNSKAISTLCILN